MGREVGRRELELGPKPWIGWRTSQFRICLPRSRGRDCARGFAQSSRPKRGVGNAGCPLHPRPRVHLVVAETAHEYTSTPESPRRSPHANGFINGFPSRPLPGEPGLVCHHHLRICPCLSPGWADANFPRTLTPSVGGGQDHATFRRTLQHLSFRLAVDRSQVFSTRPCNPHRAQKRCPRPPHPHPRVRDDRDTPPLWGGMRKSLDLIWGEWEQKYFSENQK